MNSLAEGIRAAVKYIEDNLTEELDISDIASKAFLSPFYFQKIFGVLCGFTVGEYIRCRRLTLAAEELSSGDPRVLDIAVKYGYESQESFSRAFTKFHGISPSAAKEKGARLKNFAPVQIILTLKGGTVMEYRIEEKAEITVVGKLKRFNCETSYQDIPNFWKEHFNSEDTKTLCGMYGVCIDGDGKSFDYMIADDHKPGSRIPEGYVTRVIPEGTWAVFPCMLKTLQAVNTKIWSEWLPNCKEFELAGNYNIEMYTPPAENPEESYCELWFPVKRK